MPVSSTSVPLLVVAAVAIILLAVVVALVVQLVAARRALADALAAEPPTQDQAHQKLATGVAELLAATRSGGIIVARDGRVLQATSTASTFGLVRGHELAHSELRRVFELVLTDGQTRESEFESARGRVGASRLVIGVRVARIADGLILTLIEDRTQNRRVEEVRRDFVVNVSHELKTPVGGLSLLAEAVEGAADDPVAVKRFARRMKVEAERLTKLVTEIVDLSRLQTVDMMNELTVVDVARCADEAVEQTRLVAANRILSARVATARAGTRVYGDPELITTAIRNLVTNAIAYSEDRTRVSVTTRRVNDVVEIQVSDQGRGIPLKDQERIFERFYRVDTARSRMTGGTGLGLSIVKHICANLGGEVTLWSQESQGSTFTIRLPSITNDSRPVGSAAPDSQRPAQRKVSL